MMADSPSVQRSGIQAIDKTSVHRICSGQVVLNLATAIKELVENSIDAGASSVEVRLKEYGKELVEVVDNGRGVKEENFAGLTLKHHTSKLKDFSDLVNVDTFGFRGEALSSLCALSKMSIVTCHENAEIGTKLEYDSQGKIVKQIPFPRQKGTTVSLQNLFYTLPVRHKEFIRNLKREFSKAIQVLNAYCIISTGVRITCTNQIGKGKKTTVVSTGGNPTVIENITNIFGAKQAQTLLTFTQSSPKEDICTEFGISEQQMKKDLFHISGYVSSSEHGLGRSTTDRQFYFINKRPCDPQKISRLVNDVYHMYNRHQYPFVVLDISLSKDSVDVNVTPDKRQVFVQEEKLLLAMLKSSLINLFEPRSALYKVNDGNTEKKSGGLDLWSFKKSPSKSQMSSPASENQKFGSLAGSLKRRFSSAYAKSTDELNSNLEPKQRKLDSFVASEPASKETINKDCPSSAFAAAEPSTGISEICVTSAISGGDTDLPSTSLQISENINTSEFNSVSGLDAAGNITLQTQDAENVCEEQQVDSCADMQVSSARASISADNKPDDFMQTDIPSKVDTDNCEYDSDNCEGIKSSFSLDKLTNFARFSANITTKSPRKSLTKLSSSPSPVRKSLQQFLRKPAATSEVLDNQATAKYSDSTQEQPSRTSQEFVCHMDSDENDSANSKDTISMDCMRLSDSAEKELTEPNESLTATFTEYDEAEELTRNERKIDFSMNKLKQSLQNRQASCEEARRCRNFHAQIKPTDNEVAENELKKEISKDMFSKMEILGQFNLGFIVTRLGKDLFIIDQHATDEKYNFEQLQKHTIIQSQKLIQPQRLELTAANECVLIDNLEIFHNNGFDFIIDEEAPPTQRVRLATMPISKNWTFGKEDIEELIFMLTDSPGVMCRPSRIRQMFASRACRKSIMIGTALNKAEMKKIVCRMGELEQPWNCPHGRPTMRHLINLDLLPD